MLAQVVDLTTNPHFDWHAFAPELVLVGTILVVLLADLVRPGRSSWQTSRLASVGVLLALVPVLTLASDGANRELFGGAYVVDNYALALKGFFLLATYLTILISVDHIGEGDYYQSEFYFLLLTSVLGMTVMASSRDLISIFVALETISIPTYVLAGYRKHDRKSNEAGIKYYVIGALSSAIMLYGMSFVFGVTGSTMLSGISDALAADPEALALLSVGMLLTIIGFAFKVSAFPFHWWAPDTYEGAPTPVTAFLSVASKAGGFVALLNILFFGFFGRGLGFDEAPPDTMWWLAVAVLAALTMTWGNLGALRQTNIVRMLAYSSIAQGGFILVPLAAFGIANRGTDLEAIDVATSAFQSVVIYLLVYGVMNLGAFAVVIAVARRTRSGEIESYNGLFQHSPALAVVMSMFLASLAGIPPLAGWFAKFTMFRSAVEAGGGWGYSLAIIAGANSVIAAYYYLNVVRGMWFRPAPEGAEAVRMPAPLVAAITICTTGVVAVGVYPQLFGRIAELVTTGG
jgi:NADH-quinone oxidoreductase subunit N